jgi:hypothetical protein
MIERKSADVNPFESPLPAEHGAAGANRFARMARRHPGLLVLVSLSLVVTVLFAVKQYQFRLRLEREGVVSGSRSVLDVMALPGLFPYYVVGVATNSPLAAWCAFVIGILFCYGGIGTIIDCLWKLILAGEENEGKEKGRKRG